MYCVKQVINVQNDSLRKAAEGGNVVGVHDAIAQREVRSELVDVLPHFLDKRIRQG